MAYGTFKGLKSKYYSEVTYTTDSAYSGISIFITDPKTLSLEEAIYTTGNKKPLAQMNPPGIAANKVVAKTNAAGFDTYGPDGMSFVGWHYVDGKYYLSGEKLSGINDTKLKNYINYQPWRKYPAFCIKTDGTATIRWMNHDRLKVAAPYCKTIISAFHALVYDSKSVFEYTVRDKDDDKRIIADWDDLNNTNYHHNNTLANGSTELKSNRTLLGHKANGAFVLVCTWCGMDLRVAAKMMADLGCDYAVNMDGSSAIRMRVASGYTNGVKDPGQVCGNNNTKQDYYGTASCVYLT